MTKEFLRELQQAVADLYKETWELVEAMSQYSPTQFNTEDICDIFIDPKITDMVTVCFYNEEKDEDIREYHIPFYYYENDDWKIEFEKALEVLESIGARSAKEEEKEES